MGLGWKLTLLPDYRHYALYEQSCISCIPPHIPLCIPLPSILPRFAKHFQIYAVFLLLIRLEGWGEGGVVGGGVLERSDTLVVVEFHVNLCTTCNFRISRS